MLKQTLKMAWSAIGANKMRTFLTMLGIIIGVASLIILVSIASGASGSVSEQIASIGSNYLTVQISDDKEQPLRLSEFSSLLTDDAIAHAAPVSRTSLTGKSGYTSGSVNIYGTTGSYFEIMGMNLQSGRFLKNVDTENHSYVVVISYDTAVEFFGHADAKGETLSLDGKHFLVVGVLDEDSTSSQGMGVSFGSESEEEDRTSVTLEGCIPYSILSRISDNALDITQFYVSSSDEESMNMAEASVTRIMLERFSNDEDAFSIQSQTDVMDAMAEVNNTMSIMLGGIAAISLLVGGIGIMNIMLVSVTERTREIGIRKAIGAGNGTILLQFLLEAFIVSMMGCVIGIGASFLTLKTLGYFFGDSMNFQMNGQVVWISVLFSGIIGMVFGLYPANKAAKKKPIDALRYSG